VRLCVYVCVCFCFFIGCIYCEINYIYNSTAHRRTTPMTRWISWCRACLQQTSGTVGAAIRRSETMRTKSSRPTNQARWRCVGQTCWVGSALRRQDDGWRIVDAAAMSCYLWFPPSRNAGNVGNVRNLVNVGRWRKGHTLRTLRETWKPNYIINSYWSTATASTWKIEIDSIPTDFTYTWLFCRMWFSTLHTLTTYITWRWKSRVRDSSTVAQPCLEMGLTVRQADGPPISELSAATHCQRLSVWRPAETGGGQLLALKMICNGFSQNWCKSSF